MALFVGGGIVAHMLIPGVSGQDWSAMMDTAANMDKTVIVDWTNPTPFIYGLLGGFLFDMATHGVDQDFVQRLTAGRSLKQGQWVIFLSSFLSIAMGLLFLSVGALLFVYHQSVPLPEGFNSDHVFSTFIVEHFPRGVQGLMVAGVLAATMSTLDSTINALCATLYNDILPNKTDIPAAQHLQNTSFISLALLVVALIASGSDGMLMLGLKIQSWTGGSLLGIFVTTVLLRKYITVQLTLGSVLFAYTLGTIGVALNVLYLDWNWNFNVYLGFGCSLLALWLWSKIHPNVQNSE
jgi:Na+/proline symporter